MAIYLCFWTIILRFLLCFCIVLGIYRKIRLDLYSDISILPVSISLLRFLFLNFVFLNLN